nr:reverse transcriptase domain-containing protein [Tanacetum cinerariifolium]
MKAEMAEINKNLMRVLQVNQQVKAVTLNCETCGGPHSFNDCPATFSNTQNVYAVGAYQDNSYQPQGNHNLLSYCSENYLGPPGFNQNQNRNNQNQNFHNQNRNKGYYNPQGNNQGRNQFFEGANQGQNQPLSYQALVYQALVHQSQIPQPQVFMKMNTASSSGLRTLPGNTITNPKEDLKGITTQSGAAYQGPAIPTSSTSLLVERETEATKDTVHPTNNESTEDVQPPFLQWIASRNPTPYYDPIVSTTSLTLTPFGNIDFLLEEVDAFLALEDDLTSLEVDQSYVDTEGDIILLEAFLNDNPSLRPPNQGNYLLQVRKELKICEAKSDKSSINEPPEVGLKDLPPHLEYAFLEGDDKLPVIIAKDLSVEEKIAFITVLKSHKRAIAWKLSDIKGINLEFCTHKILMEEDFEPVVQHQRRVNPKIYDVIKNEVLKLLDA